MKYGFVICVIFGMVGVFAEDCTLGKRYYSLATKAKAEYQDRDAIQFLEQAVKVCPNYDNWQELGELAATFGEPPLDSRSAQAYKAAYETYAKSPVQKARSAARYAELLLRRDQNPKRAEAWIFQAKKLDPGSKWITILAAEIIAVGKNLTSDMITRGFFSDLADKGPVLRASLEPEVDNPGTAGGSGWKSSGSFQDFPLLFYTGRAELYPESRDMVVKIAEVIGNTEQFSARKFILVGHADVRGDEDNNMVLSMQRAIAVRDLITDVENSLEGRIKVTGMGESQPRDLAINEEAHRLNRRVQIIIE